ncbi:tetraspanin-6-like isoform X1 [Diabrotica virgifera virgifera]|uniref:Uncharacterized protein n=2 Tax=Diabrotica virgifera virgifera TaxID=50390 RepID=A0ABM5JJJ9_DIAVI|nr:tetraspanin-6-like isoform X1 [Diabrotica virgifera virgifera]XP_050498115.1 tetraspanin-6-like isoform X1 [Diabrotica virgifera virgifera]XP_050498116.1 tetraspanin-6-like isoform X1 [Diabrotica virgifera virgifera]XP_050498117.1 tetraspanin-6-like isoform X1 [Diabrotica virgifera virgifera]XP_050498118.1 tetraspanin-6-like isoform X1 [Diabrotica virgifera virgifera]XP_050498119.1 tetraspanin-6-like isoform X1 [Diabrotica virgifera virgifera]
MKYLKKKTKDMMQPSTSTESWDFPWQNKMRKKIPKIVSPRERGRHPGEVCFLMCFLRLLMLTSSLVLIGISVWSIVIKIKHYRYLFDIRVDIPYFSLPAGILLLPGVWLASYIHSNRKRRLYILLLLGVITLTSILVIVGSTIGFLYSIEDANGEWHVTNSFDLPDLNKSVSHSFYQFNSSKNHQKAWNNMQQRLECCGISSYNDWTAIGLDIPSSCCDNLNCTSKAYFTSSCLDLLSRDLWWHENILKSQCYIMAVIEIGKGVLILGVYISDKLSMPH